MSYTELVPQVQPNPPTILAGNDMKQIKVGDMACTEPLVVYTSGVKAAGTMPVMESMGVEVVPAKEDMNEVRWQGIERHQSSWNDASNKGWVMWPVLSHLLFVQVVSKWLGLMKLQLKRLRTEKRTL